METDKLTRSAITAQLTIAHLQKVAYFVDFQNRPNDEFIQVCKYIIYLYTLSQSVYTENFVASFSRSMVTSRSIIGGVTFA